MKHFLIGPRRAEIPITSLSTLLCLQVCRRVGRARVDNGALVCVCVAAIVKFVDLLVTPMPLTRSVYSLEVTFFIYNPIFPFLQQQQQHGTNYEALSRGSRGAEVLTGFQPPVLNCKWPVMPLLCARHTSNYKY